MKLTLLPLILTLASCTSYVGPAYVATLGDGPALSGGTYTSGGGITVAADLREKDGLTLVCGAWAQSRQQSILTKGRAPGVLASGAIYMGRDRIAQDLSFMQEVPPAADYGGSEANCRLAERRWQGGDGSRAISIRIPRQVVYSEVDDLGGSVFVRFKQSGPGAGGG